MVLCIFYQQVMGSKYNTKSFDDNIQNNFESNIAKHGGTHEVIEAINTVLSKYYKWDFRKE